MLVDWEQSKNRNKDLERSNPVTILGKPGSLEGNKRESESRKNQKRSKKLKVLHSDLGV